MTSNTSIYLDNTQQEAQMQNLGGMVGFSFNVLVVEKNTYCGHYVEWSK